MSEFPIDLLIKQTLRSVVFDSTNMGIMSSKAEHCQSRSNTTISANKTLVESTFWSLLRSPETLKLMYEKPSEYINKIFENETFKESLNGGNDENEIQIAKNRILYSFLKDVHDSRPPPAMEWVAFQHYMYFIYRNFISSKPITTNEILPNILIKKMYELVVSLTHEDKTQFYVRIVTLLREYVLTAQGHFESIKSTADSTVYLTCLLSYYSAFCSAANKLSAVLAEFDQFINNRFHVNWFCLNQRMFFHYFFMSPSVQSKVQVFNELVKEGQEPLKKLLESYNGFIEDMSLLDRHWDVQRRRITILSERNVKEECQWLQKDWKMFKEITRIMKTNYWMIRNDDMKAIQDMDELDGHILALVGAPWYIADRIITPHGYCICEDCVTAEFQANLSNSVVAVRKQSDVSTMSRLMTCYICHDAIVVEALASHIVTKHADLNIPRADLTKTYKWRINKGMPVKRPSTKLCKVLSETMELAKQKDAQIFKVSNENIFKINNELENKSRESISKRLLQYPILINCDSGINASLDAVAPIVPETKLVNDSALTSKSVDVFKISIEPIIKIACEAPKMNNSDNMENSKFDFDDIIRSRTEATNALENCFKKCETTGIDAAVNGHVPDLPHDKDEAKTRTAAGENTLETSVWPCPLQKTQVKSAEKIQDDVKNGIVKKAPEQTVSKAALPTSAAQTNCVGHVCGHKCKEEGKYTCDHKETKKCDCAYCEVFGTSVPSHTVKTNETRDRLRTRLNQRKQTKVEMKPVVKKPDPPLATLNQNIPPVLKPNVSFKIAPKTIVQTPSPPVVVSNIKTCSHELRSSTCQNCIPSPAKMPETLDRNDDKSLSGMKANKPNINDIDELLNFIEGHKNIDKLALAQKKAAKKARQKVKKEQEKQKKEEEELARRREEMLQEAKRKADERLKAQALAKLQADQLKKNKKNSDQNKKDSSKTSKKKKKNKQRNDGAEHTIQLMEETIPAMVTIKRIVENNNSPPTVTITLKGSTPDQDKLLYTLVNGHTNEASRNNGEHAKGKNQKQPDAKQQKETNNGKKNKNKKKDGNKNEVSHKSNESSVTSSELKVTLSVDKSFRKVCPVETISKKNEKTTQQVQSKKNKQKKEVDPPKSKEFNDLDIPSLRLPPGITITKVSGPIMNKSSRTNGNIAAHPYQSVPVNKSGVIVVETEKLIQQSMTNNVNKKNKKKKNKKADAGEAGEIRPMVIINENTSKRDPKAPRMVTLKNPVFHNLRSRMSEKTNTPMMNCASEQASITKGENGMVTIRRPRCIQIPLENESPMSEFLNELKPVVQSEIPTTFTQNSVGFSYKDKKAPEIHTIISPNEKRQNNLSAHDILWGLPGIEITKVNKNASAENETKKSAQTADVSIIPTSGAEKFNLDRDDWPFESVFTPKDILEEDLDAEERELEAFKRFCQQSVPPKHKEKVAHLNVKDIVLKKKSDVTYS